MEPKSCWKQKLPCLFTLFVSLGWLDKCSFVGISRRLTHRFHQQSWRSNSLICLQPFFIFLNSFSISLFVLMLTMVLFQPLVFSFRNGLDFRSLMRLLLPKLSDCPSSAMATTFLDFFSKSRFSWIALLFMLMAHSSIQVSYMVRLLLNLILLTVSICFSATELNTGTQ